MGEGGANILEGNILGTILAVMEVFRRFVWNLFRLENEQLTNCGEFRVVRDISIHPLDPSEVPVDDEEVGQENAMRRHIAVQRRLSSTLVEVGLLNTLKLDGNRVYTFSHHFSCMDPPVVMQVLVCAPGRGLRCFLTMLELVIH